MLNWIQCVNWMFCDTTVKSEGGKEKKGGNMISEHCKLRHPRLKM